MYPNYCITKSDKQAYDQGYTYDERRAEPFITFVEKFCPLSNGEYVGQTRPLLSWHRELAKKYFGWERPNGKSRWRECQLWTPKKNAKSWFDSALCLYTCVKVKGAQVVIIASNVKQAKIVFDEIANMLRYGELKEYVGAKNMFHIQRHINKIEYRDREGFVSTIKVLSSNPNLSGFHYDLLIFDEYAEFPMTNAQLIWDRLKNGGATRGGIRLISTTPQFNRQHMSFSKYLEAKQVLSGERVDLTLLPVVYEVPENGSCICDKNCGSAWKCMEAVFKANPGAGECIPFDDFIDDYASVENNPREEARWRTLRCGQWVGQAEQWIASNVWECCGQDIDESDLWGEDAVIGIDMSRKHDLSAYCLMIRKEGKVYFLPRAFIPEQMAQQKIKTDNVRYDDWEQAGYITFTEGDTIDFNCILEHIKEDARNFRICEIRYDPNFMEYPRQLLEAEGFDCAEVSQSFAGMSGATAHFERMVLDKTLIHPNNPVMDWCLNNCKIKTDNQQRAMIDKLKAHNRIDIITSCVIASTSLLGEQEEEWTGSFCGLF